MIVVAGSSRIPPENLKRWRQSAADVIAATRAEAGCRVYSFAEDVLEPGLIRIFEIWETREHLQAHSGAPHLKTWRAVLAELGVYERSILAYEADEGSPV
jgi:quinol monooxygenase YgiN